MVSVLALSVVDLEVESQSGQTKDYKIDICYFSIKNTVLRSKIKHWLAENKNIVFEWSDLSTCGQLFQ